MISGDFWSRHGEWEGCGGETSGQVWCAYTCSDTDRGNGVRKEDGVGNGKDNRGFATIPDKYDLNNVLCGVLLMISRLGEPIG